MSNSRQQVEQHLCLTNPSFQTAVAGSSTLTHSHFSIFNFSNGGGYFISASVFFSGHTGFGDELPVSMNYSIFEYWSIWVRVLRIFPLIRLNRPNFYKPSIQLHILLWALILINSLPLSYESRCQGRESHDDVVSLDTWRQTRNKITLIAQFKLQVVTFKSFKAQFRSSFFHTCYKNCLRETFYSPMQS